MWWVLHKGDESLAIAVGGRFQLNSVGLIRRLATPVYAMTETRLLPAKTQRFIAFLRERLSAHAHT